MSALAALQPLLVAVSAAALRAQVTALSTRTPHRLATSPEGRAAQGALYEQLAGLLGPEHRACHGELPRVGEDRRPCLITLPTHNPRFPALEYADSLLVWLPGQARPHERVVLGCHTDSISPLEDRAQPMLAPGADDNASGVATLLEVLRVLLHRRARFARTIELHFYAAEESLARAALLGSRGVARRYQEENINVISMLQNDMSLYLPAGSPLQIGFLCSHTDRALSARVGEYAAAALGVECVLVEAQTGRSDHASWSEQGVSALCLVENGGRINPAMHKATDTVDAPGVSWAQARLYTQVNLAYCALQGGLLGEDQQPP